MRITFTMNLLLILTSSISLAMAISITPAKNLPRNQDIEVATEEMQKANYFTFVMLINMAPPDLFQGNITFLMPNDRAISKTDMSETSIVDFLLLHSIPSPLLINHLLHFPTGSMIPTSRPGAMLRITNEGRKKCFLNNVRVSSPNICTRAFSIRCLGVDEVVQPMMATPNCLNITSPSMGPAPSPTSLAPTAPFPAPSPPAMAPPGRGVIPVTLAPPPLVVGVSSTKSNSHKISNVGLMAKIILVKLWLFM